MIKIMLEKKVKQKIQSNKLSANESFFVFVGNKIPDGCKNQFKIRIKYGHNLLKVQRRRWIFVPSIPRHGR